MEAGDPRIRQLETLRLANLALSKSLELDIVLTHLLDYLELLVPLDSAAVLLQETATHAVLRAGRGKLALLPAELVRLDIRANVELNRIATTRQILQVGDTQTDPDWEPYLGHGHGASWIGAPLTAGGELVGLLSLEKQEPNFFEKTHLELVESLAAQAGIAI